jgi:hypothetical protein
MTQPSVGVLIRSYRRDFEWLRYCLAALAKFLPGVPVTVVVPRSSEPWLPRVGPALEAVTLHICADSGDDYLGQQVTKMYADEYLDADFICHVDSDCILDRPLRAADLAPGGRPVLAYRPLERYERRPVWIEAGERYLGWPLDLDYMCRPPFVYPRWLYPLVRAHGSALSAMPFERYVMSQPPRGFSEFTALGGFAHRHHREAFRWLDADAAPDPAPFRWYWSWEGISPSLRAELDKITR